jgi:hypothetical protein
MATNKNRRFRELSDSVMKAEGRKDRRESRYRVVCDCRDAGGRAAKYQKSVRISMGGS